MINQDLTLTEFMRISGDRPCYPLVNTPNCSINLINEGKVPRIKISTSSGTVLKAVVSTDSLIDLLNTLPQAVLHYSGEKMTIH